MRGVYKHSVTELDTDTESNGYASISFSDSDTASETPEVSYTGASSVLSSEQLSLDTLKYIAVPRQEKANPRDTLTGSLEAQMDRRKSRASVSGPDDTYQMPKALDQPVEPRYTQPKGYVGFSSLPDQVCSCSCYCICSCSCFSSCSSQVKQRLQAVLTMFRFENETNAKLMHRF